VNDDRAYLFDPANWRWASPQSIPHRILEHLEFTAIALAIAAAIAIPIGFYIGHTNRGAFFAINIGNAGRSLPTFGLLSLIVTLVGLGQLPLIFALVVLAVPPILTTTYAGLRAVDPAAVDSARGMGMRSLQILFRAEVPMALPLILSGLRSAALQVVATATVAAYVGLGGLGRLLIDGLSLNQYDRVVAGAVLVAALAIVIDLGGGLLQRLVVSPGVSGRFPTASKASVSTTVPEAAGSPA
jgi:osmoprotectant transport system permease protein